MKFSSIAWGITSVFGGFLLQFTMGAFYSFGNMMTYMASYMRYYGNAPNITYTEFMIVQSTWGMTQGIVMPFSGFIIGLIGEKTSMLAGATIFSAGCALTYITIHKELWMVAATYGFVSAFGQNIALIPTLTTGMKWFPNHKGTVMGIVVGGFGGGAMVFNEIQTKIVNPNNVSPIGEDGKEKYFEDENVLNRVPYLLLILAFIYFILGMIGATLIVQPSVEWIAKNQRPNAVISTDDEDCNCDEINESDKKRMEKLDIETHALEKDSEAMVTMSVSWKEAFRTKEFYLLWITRLSVVLISQVISGLYKAFGTTFIDDDRFLTIVGTISSIFNCFGRLLYGFIMDKTSYRIGMSIESVLLTLLVSTFYLTSLIGSSNISETSMTTKVVYAVWVWSIYLTFPGTYSMQPAVTAQTFGPENAGKIYAFLFSSDIINNLMVAIVCDALVNRFGYVGLFLFISMWGIIALIATLNYPKHPNRCKTLKGKRKEKLEKL